MPHLRYLASARLDIAQIQAYITRESRSLAIGRGFAHQLRLKCIKLASLPGHMGRARDEIGEGLRSSAYKGYIFFRYVGDEFQIVNILEGHRDAASHFGLDAADDSETDG
ncbi:type II toxin-antitoxin system RelE/ParE family toxin [Rhizobium sp. XQZ8]|uniref:type II toxin-antitoxin system RelE/ParE family toxin n=1 Tax=Rhizobium populisoli TaxID=2859785 RepID=UPI001CA5BD61|nr:type II toxin-antitoxin system RelE/ParE family toxin [Rhizobium populisoli]MBW6421106.1 type II toxin-antitoxin system RelE/ParE family toxin [Rhizobium populisoli]